MASSRLYDILSEKKVAVYNGPPDIDVPSLLLDLSEKLGLKLVVMHGKDHPWTGPTEHPFLHSVYEYNPSIWSKTKTPWDDLEHHLMAFVGLPGLSHIAHHSIWSLLSEPKGTFIHVNCGFFEGGYSRDEMIALGLVGMQHTDSGAKYDPKEKIDLTSEEVNLRGLRNVDELALQETEYIKALWPIFDPWLPAPLKASHNDLLEYRYKLHDVFSERYCSHPIKANRQPLSIEGDD